jgi:hypothetical protein
MITKISKTLIKLSIILLLINILSFSVFAARPFVTDDAGTVEKGKIEIEPSTNFGKDNAFFGLTLKHGLTERADINFNFGYYTNFENDQLERKICPPSIMFKIAFIPDLFTTSIGMCFGKTEYFINLIGSKSFGKFSGDINIGYITPADTNDADITYGLDVVYKINKFDVGAEIFGTQEMANWQIGIRFSPAEWITIDLAGGTTIEPNPVFTGTAGLCVGF